MKLKQLRYVLWALIAIIVVATILLLTRQNDQADRQLVKIDIGGPFSMTSHLGLPVTEKDYLGKPIAMFFGFTSCPDICPTTLLRMTDLMAKLGPDADRLQVVLVSVDPERDNPEVLKAYLEQFDPRITAMTGTPEQLAAFAKGYRFVYRKVPSEGNGYTVDHTAGVFLFDSQGKFVSTVDPHEDDAIVLGKLRRLMK